MRVTDRRETTGERCQNKMELSRPLSGPRRCSPDILKWEESGLLKPEGNVGRLYTGCLLAHRSSFFFLVAIDNWTSFLLKLIEKYTKLQFIRDSRKKFHYLLSLSSILKQFIVLIIEDQVNIIKEIKGNYLFR